MMSLYDEAWWRAMARRMRQEVSTLDLAAVYSERANLLAQGAPNIELVGMLRPSWHRLDRVVRVQGSAAYWAALGGDLPDPGSS